MVVCPHITRMRSSDEYNSLERLDDELEVKRNDFQAHQTIQSSTQDRPCCGKLSQLVLVEVCIDAVSQDDSDGELGESCYAKIKMMQLLSTSLRHLADRQK